MSLEAEITRIQLNNLPSSIIERLLKRRDIATMIKAGSAEVGDVGQFRFADVRDALLSAPLGTSVNVPTSDGRTISITRSSDAMFRAREGSSVESVLPELSLLDPSAEVRLKGVTYLSERALPNWPKSLSWQAVATKNSLADSDFGMVLDELQSIAEPALDGIVSKLLSGEFGVLDLIPTSKTYYESLLGPIPWTMDVSQYVTNVLIPHLINVFRKDPSWGLRCVHAACIGEVVDPVRAAADVSNDDLISSIESVGIGTTPFALSVTYRLASSRVSADRRFSPIANQALQFLAGKTNTSEPSSGFDSLLVGLVRLTLGILGQTEELASAPPFWRRLAAFAHTTVILEAIHIPDASAKEIGAWCLKCLTQQDVLVENLDHLAEPGWRTDNLNPQNIWASALLRAIRSTSENARAPSLSDAQLEQAQARLFFVAGSPDPLSGARRDWSTCDSPTMNEDFLNDADSENADGSVIAPMQVWTVLAHYAQIYPFSDSLLVRVRDLAKALKSQAILKFCEAYTPLALCCYVASTQADIELAELVVDSVIDACDEFVDPSDATLAASIVVLAAGATKDQSTGLQWAGERLLALAYRLPQGACCAALAQTITTFQRWIPLSKRRWGKAFIVANSAAV